LNFLYLFSYFFGLKEETTQQHKEIRDDG